jgi:hypothetical protein
MSDRFNAKDELKVNLKDEHQTYLAKTDLPPNLNELDVYMEDVMDEYVMTDEEKVPADELKTRTSQKKRKPKL